MTFGTSREPAPWVREAQKTGCGILPKPAETLLMQASRAAPASVRRKLIDRAYDRTSQMYPNLFKD